MLSYEGVSLSVHRRANLAVAALPSVSSGVPCGQPLDLERIANGHFWRKQPVAGAPDALNTR
jgi:hypothetical protein